MRGGLAQHFAAFGVERSVKRERAVAVILKAVAFHAAGRQWQHRIQPVQRLDGSLLVDAKHRRMLRRFDVQSDDVGGLGLELGIVGEHVALDPVGLKSGPLPDPRHHHVVDPQLLGQFAAAPMRRAITRTPAGRLQNPRFERGGTLLHRPARMARVQTGQTLGHKATLPAADVAGVATQRGARSPRRPCPAPASAPAAHGAHLRPAPSANARAPAVHYVRWKPNQDHS